MKSEYDELDSSFFRKLFVGFYSVCLALGLHFLMSAFPTVKVRFLLCCSLS